MRFALPAACLLLVVAFAAAVPELSLGGLTAALRVLPVRQPTPVCVPHMLPLPDPLPLLLPLSLFALLPALSPPTNMLLALDAPSPFLSRTSSRACSRTPATPTRPSPQRRTATTTTTTTKTRPAPASTPLRVDATNTRPARTRRAHPRSSSYSPPHTQLRRPRLPPPPPPPPPVPPRLPPPRLPPQHSLLHPSTPAATKHPPPPTPHRLPRSFIR